MNKIIRVQNALHIDSITTLTLYAQQQHLHLRLTLRFTLLCSYCTQAKQECTNSPSGSSSKGGLTANAVCRLPPAVASSFSSASNKVA